MAEAESTFLIELPAGTKLGRYEICSKIGRIASS